MRIIVLFFLVPVRIFMSSSELRNVDESELSLIICDIRIEIKWAENLITFLYLFYL